MLLLSFSAGRENYFSKSRQKPAKRAVLFFSVVVEFICYKGGNIYLLPFTFAHRLFKYHNVLLFKEWGDGITQPASHWESD